MPTVLRVAGSNLRSHDLHHSAAAGTQDRRALPDPGCGLVRNEPQQHVQQRDQTLAVRMQEAKVAGTPEAFG